MNVKIAVLLLCFIPVITLAQENVLKLELEFGAENLPDEYLLNSPDNVLSDNSGKIYVSDSKDPYVKIFDGNGNPLKILGGRGEGPGEFGRRGYTMSLSPQGYFSAFDALYLYNIFDNEYNLIESKQVRTLPIFSMANTSISSGKALLSKLVPMDKDRRIYNIQYSDTGMHYSIYYQGKDGNIERISHIVDDDRKSGIREVWYNTWDILPDNSIVISSSEFDVKIEKDKMVYTLRILSPEDGSIDTITRTTGLMEIPAETKEQTIALWKDRADRSKTASSIERYNTIKKHYDNNKYIKPIDKILTDRNYIFVFTPGKNETEKILVDVFDSESLSYLRSVDFPFIPMDIQNEYVFNIQKNSEGFFEVFKYRIDPAVYAK
ncbi:6-bladed beta-propeller [candidate division KSB1 bacterium]